MSGNTFGKIFCLTSFGESHGKALGCVVDGCPPGLKLNESDIQHDLNRRKPGKSKYTSQRKESDKVEILSGVFEGKTTGTPICLLIANEDQKPRDYSEIKEWKSLTLKSWAAQGNEKILYQEASLEIFMKPEEIIDFVKEEIQSDVNNSIILCGTPPLIPEQIIYTNK